MVVTGFFAQCVNVKAVHTQQLSSTLGVNVKAVYAEGGSCGWGVAGVRWVLSDANSS